MSHIKGMVDAIGAQNETRGAGQRHRAKLKTDLAAAVEQGDTDRARVLRERIKAMGEPLPITGPASIRRIRATLSSALSSALADAVEQLLIPPVNPAKLFRLKGGGRPKGLVWTSARVAAWLRPGSSPSLSRHGDGVVDEDGGDGDGGGESVGVEDPGAGRGAVEE